MTNDPAKGDQISAVVTGAVQGQVAVGKDISQEQMAGSMQARLTPGELHELTEVFAGLRQQLAAAVPETERAAALERVGELEQAVKAKEPDLTTIQYVKQWFARKLPAAAGLIASVLVHPIVGKVVERAGDQLADSIT